MGLERSWPAFSSSLSSSTASSVSTVVFLFLFLFFAILTGRIDTPRTMSLKKEHVYKLSTSERCVMCTVMKELADVELWYYCHSLW